MILDTIVSSILGRPGGLPSFTPEEDNKSSTDEAVDERDRPSDIASRATFTISSHIIELEQRLGSGHTMDADAAESYLQRLRQWNEDLPSELRHFTGAKQAALGPADRELFIGATHV